MASSSIEPLDNAVELGREAGSESRVKRGTGVADEEDRGCVDDVGTAAASTAVAVPAAAADSGTNEADGDAPMSSSANPNAAKQSTSSS